MINNGKKLPFTMKIEKLKSVTMWPIILILRLNHMGVLKLSVRMIIIQQTLMMMGKLHKIKILMMITITLAVTRLTNLIKQKIISENYLVWIFHRAQSYLSFGPASQHFLKSGVLVISQPKLVSYFIKVQKLLWTLYVN